MLTPFTVLLFAQRSHVCINIDELHLCRRSNVSPPCCNSRPRKVKAGNSEPGPSRVTASSTAVAIAMISFLSASNATRKDLVGGWELVGGYLERWSWILSPLPVPERC